jgi:hypothetical protein
MPLNLSQEAISARDLEIVTIVFDREIELFRLQARSLARNISAEFRRIHVILNEPASSGFYEEVAAIVETEFGHSERERVRIWSSRDLLSVSDPRGWFTQQILKLKIASYVESEKYVVLDAKNHLIRKTDVNSFLSPDGRPYMARTFNNMPLKDYILGSLRTFGLDSNIADQYSMPSITPFVLYRDCVLAMMKDIERIHGRQFDDYFLYGENLVSEFGLYSAYFIANDINLEDAYWCDRAICITFWKQWMPTEEKQLKALSVVANEGIVMLGLHRNCMVSMSDKARATIFDIWIEAGLFKDASDAATYWQLLEKTFAFEAD